MTLKWVCKYMFVLLWLKTILKGFWCVNHTLRCPMNNGRTNHTMSFQKCWKLLPYFLPNSNCFHFHNYTYYTILFYYTEVYSIQCFYNPCCTKFLNCSKSSQYENNYKAMYWMQHILPWQSIQWKGMWLISSIMTN